MHLFTRVIAWIGIITAAGSIAAAEPETVFTVEIDRGRDIGQAFGGLFEATTSDGALTIGAGFPNLYNTRYRADRHDVQFYLRPAKGERRLTTTELPRPNDLCGAYLYSRDGVVRQTYGGVSAWNPSAKSWMRASQFGGTAETMRLGDARLRFGDSEVTYKGRKILTRPEKGSYQLFFYARGWLCFYHVNRNDGPYRPYKNDADGFSKLYACPWLPNQLTVDLRRAIIHTLPVVGETTFAWGQLGEQIVTGSNIGGFYVFENERWRMLLEPQLGVSYQLYSTIAYHDRLLMGQYPTGRLFEYDGEKITDQAGWPPVMEGVSGSAREAQTTVVYGGELFVGVWPWAELWRYHRDQRRWIFTRRMFEHPAKSNKIVHPYDVENHGNPVGNLWGQRVTSLVASGPDLYVSTSAKYPCTWEPEKYPFLAADDKWRSYGAVYRLTMPGHLSAPTRWTNGATKLQFTIRGDVISISQDGKKQAEAKLTGALAELMRKPLKFDEVKWGASIYGPFGGKRLKGAAE